MRKGYGFFGYFDPDDKRVFVPKENPSMGWTINVGHPLGAPLAIGLVSAVVVTVIVAARQAS